MQFGIIKESISLADAHRRPTQIDVKNKTQRRHVEVCTEVTYRTRKFGKGKINGQVNPFFFFINHLGRSIKAPIPNQLVQSPPQEAQGQVPIISWLVITVYCVGQLADLKKSVGGCFECIKTGSFPNSPVNSGLLCLYMFYIVHQSITYFFMSPSRLAVIFSNSVLQITNSQVMSSILIISKGSIFVFFAQIKLGLVNVRLYPKHFPSYTKKKTTFMCSVPSRR